MVIEFARRSIRFKRQFPLAVLYEGQPVGEGRVDFLVEDEVIVELKAVDAFHPIHSTQVISYLKATGHRLALLLNSNIRKLTDGIQRVPL